MKSQFPGDDSIWIQVVSWLCYLAFLKFAPKMLSISNFKIQKGNLKWEVLFIHKNSSGLGLSKILFNDFIQIRSQTLNFIWKDKWCLFLLRECFSICSVIAKVSHAY